MCQGHQVGCGSLISLPCRIKSVSADGARACVCMRPRVQGVRYDARNSISNGISISCRIPSLTWNRTLPAPSNAS